MRSGGEQRRFEASCLTKTYSLQLFSAAQHQHPHHTNTNARSNTNAAARIVHMSRSEGKEGLLSRLRFASLLTSGGLVYSEMEAKSTLSSALRAARSRTKSK